MAQLNALYRVIGWEKDHRRTEAETGEMERVSHYSIAAQMAGGRLAGCARVCGDPYVAHVLDGIPPRRIAVGGLPPSVGVGGWRLQRPRDASVLLTDGNGIAGFYQRFGVRIGKDVAPVWERGIEARSKDANGAR